MINIGTIKLKLPRTLLEYYYISIQILNLTIVLS